MIYGSIRTPGYLGRAKVRALLLVSLTESLQEIIMTATDKLIVGNLVGTDAVSGTMLISPVFSLGACFEILVGTGASVLYARSIGDYDDERRRRVLGMSSIIALVFGLFMCMFSFACEDMIFDVLGAGGVIRSYGEEYFYFYRFTFLITPLFSFLSEIVFIDGDELRALLSGLALLFGNAILSFFFTRRLGVLGASLGSAIGTVLSLIIILSHFFVKKYRVRLLFSPDFTDLKEMLLVGGADASNSVFDFLYSFLLNMFVIRVFDEKYLAVLAVTSIVYEMMEIGGGVNDAMKTMLLSYRGDNNTKAMKSLLMYGLRITFIMGIVFIAAVWIAAPLIPAVYGIRTGEMVPLTVWACRLISLSSIACVINGVFLEYYLSIGKYKLQMLGNFLDTLVIRLLCNVLFALPFGVIGIWIGESICTYVSVVILLIFIYIHYGRDSFPFLLKDSGRNSLSLSFCAIPEEIVLARDRLEAFLNENRVTKAVNYLLMLFLEEICVLIRDSNPPEKTVNVDTYFTFSRDAVHMVIWSDGVIMDMTDKDRAPGGLAAYLVSFFISGFEESKYQNTAGYNRACFVIPYKRLLKERRIVGDLLRKD